MLCSMVSMTWLSKSKLRRRRCPDLPGCLVVSRNWRDDVDCREVCPVPADIAGQQAVARYGGMRADVEVRHGRAFVAAAAPVPHERLPCGETGQVGQGLAFVVAGREQFIKLFDG